MLKTNTLIVALCCCLNSHLSYASFFFGGNGGSPFYSSPVAQHFAAQAPVAPVTRFAHNSGPVFKYNLPIPTAYAALSAAAHSSPNVIKYTLGPPVTTTTTTYNTFATGAFASPALPPAAPLHATIGYSEPITRYAAPPTLPIFKYATPQAFAAYSSAPLAISYAAPAPVSASSYGAW